MSRLSMSRKARLGVLAGILATAGVAAAISVGTANAAGIARGVGEAAKQYGPVQVNFDNTRINSVEMFRKDAARNWFRACVTRDPSVGDHDVSFEADMFIIRSFDTGDCTGEPLHSDTISQPGEVTGLNTWVILLETLDDDDDEQWTA